MLAEKHMEASARMARGPPAFERFPDQAFRYRDWGAFTRHARGDAYPLYTLDTMRNLADHLFDSSTGWASAPERARQVRPCDLLYSTLRPTSAFLHHVHSHIKVRYLLMTDTADEPITLYPAVRTLLESKTLAHWYAVDNEVLDHPKLDSIPLGVTDALEIGKRAEPSSVEFHTNTSAYLGTLRASQAQSKSQWLMMQMSETHAERRRVRSTFHRGWGDATVQLTPESTKRLRVSEYLMALGRHRFVISPRGNGLDAHRTWETLLVGSIPIVRSSALNPLYEALPVLIVDDWSDVTPSLLRAFYANYTMMRPLYQYERLFADYWIGRFAVSRERCLAEVRAAQAPRFTYDYRNPGGWAPLSVFGYAKPPPRWAPDAAKGG